MHCPICTQVILGLVATTFAYARLRWTARQMKEAKL